MFSSCRFLRYLFLLCALAMKKFFASEASRVNNNARREQECVLEPTSSAWVANARAKLAKEISYGMGDGEVEAGSRRKSCVTSPLTMQRVQYQGYRLHFSTRESCVLSAQAVMGSSGLHLYVKSVNSRV